MPTSTQWDIIAGVVPKLVPAHQECVRQAAQGEVIHNDDTTARILQLMGAKAKDEAPATGSDDAGIDPERTGTWTSGIVATAEGQRIALFFTGRQHAGENLSDLHKNRAATLGSTSVGPPGRT